MGFGHHLYFTDHRCLFKEDYGILSSPVFNCTGCCKCTENGDERKICPESLIHHSDHGVQYCCFEYILLLKKAGIKISMTENGETYETPIAERINGIFKTEFKLKHVFSFRSAALLEVTKCKESFNHLRPHMSCDYLTPVAAYIAEKPLIKR